MIYNISVVGTQIMFIFVLHFYNNVGDKEQFFHEY